MDRTMIHAMVEERKRWQAYPLFLEGENGSLSCLTAEGEGFQYLHLCGGLLYRPLTNEVLDEKEGSLIARLGLEREFSQTISGHNIPVVIKKGRGLIGKGNEYQEIAIIKVKDWESFLEIVKRAQKEQEEWARKNPAMATDLLFFPIGESKWNTEFRAEGDFPVGEPILESEIPAGNRIYYSDTREGAGWKCILENGVVRRILWPEEEE